MKLAPKTLELAKKLLAAGVLRGLNMQPTDLQLIGRLVNAGLAKKTADHKQADIFGNAWMFKYEPTKALKELSL